MSEQPLLQVHNLKTYFYTEDGVMPSVDGVDFDLHEARPWPLWVNPAVVNL